MTQEQEQLLGEVPKVVGADAAGNEPDWDVEVDRIDSDVDERSVALTFNEEFVRDSLKESFAFASRFFESDHWLLTETQARMLSAPSKQLLTSLWVHINRMLPMWLAQWSTETPGLMDCVLAFSIVLTPKVVEQMKVSRTRKAAGGKPNPITKAGPQSVASTVRNRPMVEPMDGSEDD